MKRSKLFWRSLLMSLAVILPFYLVVAAYGFSRAAPVQEIRADVPITHPTSTDAKTLLVMTGAEEPEHFVLLRFDAMENRVATMAVPAQLAVPGTGGQQSLLQAVQSAARSAPSRNSSGRSFPPSAPARSPDSRSGCLKRFFRTDRRPASLGEPVFSARNQRQTGKDLLY